MKTSTIVVAAHAVFDVLVVSVCLAASVVVTFYPGTVSTIVVVLGSVALALAMKALWLACDGCPVTHFENKLRIREGKEPYTEPCLVYYARRLLGINVPHATCEAVSHVIFLAPALAGAIHLLA
jgi:hypothetical protein